MSALSFDGHFIISRSLEESFKKAMDIYIKTINDMKRKGKGPNTEAENDQFRMLSNDFATLFPLLYGLILDECKPVWNDAHDLVAREHQFDVLRLIFAFVPQIFRESRDHDGDVQTTPPSFLRSVSTASSLLSSTIVRLRAISSTVILLVT